MLFCFFFFSKKQGDDLIFCPADSLHYRTFPKVPLSEIRSGAPGGMLHCFRKAHRLLY